VPSAHRPSFRWHNFGRCDTPAIWQPPRRRSHVGVFAVGGSLDSLKTLIYPVRRSLTGTRKVRLSNL
jgi:hypothetical protein